MKLRKILTGVFAAALLTSAATAAYAAEVTVGADGEYETFETLMTAVQGGQAALASGDTIKVVSDVEVKSTITIPSGYDLTLDLNGKTVTSNLGQNGRPFYVYGKLTVDGNGKMYGDSWGVFDVKEGGELTLKSGSYYAPGYNYDEGYKGSGCGSTLRTRWNSKLTVDDGVYVYCEIGGAAYCEGDLYAGECTFESESHTGRKDQYGASLWSYCVNTYSEAILTDTTVLGIQGALFIGGDGTINGGTYKAAENYDLYTGNRSHYGLYISNGATVVINDGEFFGGNANKYCVLNGDNDVGQELGSPIVINGGTFHQWVGSEGGTTEGFIINGGTFLVTNGLESALSSGKMIDENGTVVDIPAVELADAKPFVDEKNPEEEAGYYFDLTTSARNKTAVATFTDGAKTLEKTLDLSKVDGEGEIAFSILLLNAPQNVSGTILYR